MEVLVLRELPKGKRLVNDGKDPSPASVEDHSQKDISALQRDKNVIGIANPMPLFLIEPVAANNKENETSAELHKSDVTWGIQAVGAADSKFDGSGVTVAVLDTGIYESHAAFKGVRIIGKNFTGGDPKDFDDKVGHGTHCAGTIFGRAINGKRIGVAPGITQAVIAKVLGPNGGSTGTLVKAINWAIENKAHIISMSLGMNLVGYRNRLIEEGYHKYEAESMAMRVLIDNVRFFDKFGNMLRSGVAFDHSALIIAASGNDSNRIGKRPFIVGAAYPANTEDFLSVGAIEKTEDVDHPFRVANFSNAGAKFVGPGVQILSSIPKDGLGIKSGTSMATPHIAGVAALWAQKTMLTKRFLADRVRSALEINAKSFSGLDEADVGLGIPQAPNS